VRRRDYQLDADVERPSPIDPGDLDPAVSTSRYGHVHGGLRDHRPRVVDDLEPVIAGGNSSQLGGAQHTRAR
jgi:hypothetical protein